MKTNTIFNKAVLLLCSITLLSIMFAGCAQPEPPAPVVESVPEVESVPGDSVVAPFNTANWLDIPENAAKLEFIQVEVFPPPDPWVRGVAPIAHLEANENEKQIILEMLAPVFFAPADAWNDDMTVDFAFGMNEPFLFFSFDDKGLHAKVPGPDSTGYLYYFAPESDPVWGEELMYFRAFIGEMRLVYYGE